MERYCIALQNGSQFVGKFQAVPPKITKYGQNMVIFKLWCTGGKYCPLESLDLVLSAYTPYTPFSSSQV
jgi:hypothetical protein